MTRWFHIAGLAWLASLICILALDLPKLLLFGIGGSLLLGLLAFRRRKLPLWVFSAAVAICFSIPYCAIYEWAALKPVEAFEGQTLAVRGVVTDWDTAGNGRALSLRLQPEGLPKELAGTKVRVKLPVGMDVEIGDVVEYTLKLTCAPKRRAALYADGFRYEAAVYYQPQKVGRSRTPEVMLADYRMQIRTYLTELLPGGEGALLAAMLTGKTGGISPDTRNIYARAGISHLLAVSGLHLAILTSLLGSFLRLFALSRRRQAIGEMLAVLLFMALTGFPHSVMRAGLMLLLSRTALLLGRDADTLNSLGASLVVILLLNPYAALDVGLQLSYFATMGIVLFAAPMTKACKAVIWKKGHKPPWVAMAALSTACVTCTASLFTTPLICWYFGQLSTVSIVVNIIIIPFTTIALTSALLCAGLGFFPLLQPLSKALGLVAGLAMRAIDAPARWFAAWKYAAIPVREGYQLLWFIVVLFLMLVLYYRKTPWRVVVWTMELSVCILLVGVFSRAVLRQNSVELAAVRSGESVVFRFAQQAAVVGSPSGTYELQQLERFLNDSKIDSISLLVIDRQEQAYEATVRQFQRRFAVEQTVVLEEVGGFEADLFGERVRIFSKDATERVVWIEAGDFLIAKDFLMRPQAADLLFNARNELVKATALELRQVERYYGATVLELSVLHSIPGEKEGLNEK